ncbi:MAG TPA: MmgE/PrpD family protein [Stellaceae bacterium]|jgi:2-methylcitrate dehydratase PrpD|nr:MmgE/PrpD family protein [Stellaceae bacterium]
MSAARSLASFLTRLTPADLPAQAMDHAAMLIASTLASASMGTGIESAQIIRDMARERGGTPQASLWFDNGAKLPVSDAAQANAVTSDAAASDDSDLRQIVHCGTPLVATSLALAEHLGAGGGASGEEILAAIVIGYEAAGRVTDVMPHFRSRGFHGSTGAIFAASGAAARLLKLDETQTTHTIALTATSVSGLVKAADTSVAREYHCGNATLLGIQAARAAQRGYTGEADILDMKGGFFDVYGGEDGPAATATMLQDLGGSWDIVTDMAVKLVPGGHPYHAFGEAAANASREAQVSPDEIDSITVSRPGLTALGGPRHPANLIDMAHSPAYFTAAGAADRAFSWQHASPEKIADPVIHRLIDKVRVGPPPTAHIDRYRQGASVTIRTRDGREFTNTVFAPKGSGLLGIDWADIDAKFRTLMPLSGLPARQIEDALGIIRDFRTVSDVSDLIRLLCS